MPLAVLLLLPLLLLLLLLLLLFEVAAALVATTVAACLSIVVHNMCSRTDAVRVILGASLWAQCIGPETTFLTLRGPRNLLKLARGVPMDYTRVLDYLYVRIIQANASAVRLALALDVLRRGTKTQ